MGSFGTQQVFGILSALGCVIVLLSFWICVKWTKRMPPVKWLLFVMSVFNLVRALNYTYVADSSTDELCRIQASIMQIFAVGSTLYAFIMALETSILLGIITTNTADRLRLSLISTDTKRRHYMYHFIVNVYGIAVTIWMNAAGVYGDDKTPWCYFSRPIYRIYFTYIPIWTSFVGIFYLDIGVIKKVLWSYKKISSVRATRSDTCDTIAPTEGGGDISSLGENLNTKPVIGAPGTKERNISEASSVNTVDTMNSKMINLFARMILHPLLLMVLLLPGFVLRMGEISGSPVNGISRDILSILQRACDPSAGIVLAVVWIVFDLKVREEWAAFFVAYLPPKLISAISNTMSCLSRSVSVRGNIATVLSSSNKGSTELSHTISNQTSQSSKTFISETSNPLGYPSLNNYSIDSTVSRDSSPQQDLLFPEWTEKIPPLTQF